MVYERTQKEKTFTRAIFIQDGATPHTVLSTRAFLKQTFKDHLLGKHSEKQWSPYSPDLIPAEFHLWPVRKRRVYTGNNTYKSVAVLKRAITYHFRWF